MVITFTEQEFKSLEAVYLRLLNSRTNNIVRVNAGGNLQKALDDAEAGSTILLEQGASYPGPIILPPRNHFPSVKITSRLENVDAKIGIDEPVATLFTPSAIPVLQTTPGTSGWEFSDIAFDCLGRVNNLISLGSLGSSQSHVDAVPKKLGFNRVRVMGLDKQIRRAFQLCSDETSITNSHIEGIGQDGQDSQAILGANCVGKHIIANNFLEASTEIVMYGGSDSRSPELIPTNIDIFKNTITRRLSWRTGTHLAYKNLMEFKVGRKVNIYENGLSNHWGNFAIWLKSVDQSDSVIAPWMVVEELNFYRNIMTDVAAGFNLHRNPEGTAMPMNRVSIYDNTIEISKAKYGSHGWFAQVYGVDDLSIIANKIVTDGSSVLYLHGGPTVKSKRLKIQNNDFTDNIWGIKGESSGEGVDTLNTHAEEWIMTGNKIKTASPGYYPANNIITPVES